MKKTAICIILFGVGMLLAGAWPGAAAPSYTCLDLNKSPGMELHGVYPCGIDAAGEVVGYTYKYTSSAAFLIPGGAGLAPVPRTPTSGDSAPIAFFWNTNGFIGLPPVIPPDPPLPNEGWEAQSIGRDGKHMGGKWWKAGSSGEPAKPQAWVGERGSSATWDLGSFGGTRSWANAVNDGGQAVGAAAISNGGEHAFLWSGGVLQDLNTLAQNLPPGVILAEGRDINNARKVVGNCSGAKGTAFLYDGTYHDLGTIPPGGPLIGSFAYAINDAGQVVGESDITIDPMPIYYAFLWDGGPEMKDLGTLPGGNNSRAYDINNAGQVVGYSDTASGVHAFLYTGGVMYDLNDLVVNLPAGEVLFAAYGINDRGQIIAGGAHGYLLTPVSALAGVDLLLLQ